MTLPRTYTVEPLGKKFATICRDDGFFAIAFVSKNKKAARKKGDDFIAGTRTAVRKYTTPYGRALNEEKSRNPNRSMIEILGAHWSTFKPLE